MFNKLKHLKDLRSQAKQMQNALADETITVEKKGLKISMNGNMEITEVKISEEMSNEKLESVIKDNINDSIKQTQRLMARKMQEMGGLPGLG